MFLIGFVNMNKLVSKHIKSTMVSKTFSDLSNNHHEHQFLKNGPQFVFSFLSQPLPVDEDGLINKEYFEFELYEGALVKNNSYPYNYDWKISSNI